MTASTGQRVAIAKARRPWGLDGSVIVTPYSHNSPALIAGSKVFAGVEQYEIARVRKAGSGLALTFAGIETPEQAEKFRGLDLEILESALPPAPEGIYYHYQIIGLLVVTTEGRTLGRVKEILETPGNDVYVVVPEAGGNEILVPAIGDVIKEIDVKAGVITADPPEAL